MFWFPHFLILTLLSAAQAWHAPGIAVVGLHMPGLSQADSLELSMAISQALDQGTRVDGIPPQELADNLYGIEHRLWTEIHQGAGLEALQAAKRSFLDLDAKSALCQAQTAVRVLTDALQVVPDGAPLVRALVMEARVHMALWQPIAARECLRLALILDPALDLDPTEYPPELVLAARGISDDLRQQGLGSVRVQVDGGDARVHLDGRLSGPAPLIVHDLPAGMHHVLVRGALGQVTHELVEVKPHVVTAHRVDLTYLGRPPRQMDPADCLAEVHGLYRTLGKYLQTEFLLLGGMVQENVFGLQLYSVYTDAFSTPVLVEVAKDYRNLGGEVALELMQHLTYTGSLRPDRQADPLCLDTQSNIVLEALLFDPESLGVLDLGGNG